MTQLMKNRDYKRLKRKEFNAVMATMAVFEDGIEFLPEDARYKLQLAILFFNESHVILKKYWKKA